MLIARQGEKKCKPPWMLMLHEGILFEWEPKHFLLITRFWWCVMFTALYTHARKKLWLVNNWWIMRSYTRTACLARTRWRRPGGVLMCSPRGETGITSIRSTLDLFHIYQWPASGGRSSHNDSPLYIHYILLRQELFS